MDHRPQDKRSSAHPGPKPPGTGARSLGWLPSAFMIQIPQAPPRSEINATRLPSGEKVAPRSWAGSAVSLRAQPWANCAGRAASCR